MADRRADVERAADLAKVEREDVKESAAAEAAERVVPPAPPHAEERVEELAENQEVAEEQVEADESPLTHVLTLDPEFQPAGASEPLDSVRVAFPGSHEVSEADEYGYIELSEGAEVAVSAAVARNAEGVAAVNVAVAEDAS